MLSNSIHLPNNDANTDISTITSTTKGTKFEICKF